MGAPLFDNAPIAVIETAEPKDLIQLVYPYYDNPEFFERQLLHWSSYDPLILGRLSVIVVDDGSPSYPAEQVVRKFLVPFNLRLFRIDVDVRWNWLAARNIGMHYAKNDWCILTDMDHVIPKETIHSVLHGKHDEKVIYRFSRRESTGAVIHPHPNSMLMTRAMFWKVGGYDETLSGFYGTDGDWRRRCSATARIATLRDELERHEKNGDSSTVRYLRKQPCDAGKKVLVEARKRVKNWRPKTLSFPYHEVNFSA